MDANIRDRSNLDNSNPDQVEKYYNNLTPTKYISERSGLKRIFLTITSIASSIFIMPGVVSTFPVSTLDKVKQVVIISSSFWTKFLSEGRYFPSLAAGAYLLLTLPTALGSAKQDYAQWRIDNIVAFQRMQSIPVSIHNDEFLSTHICPISLYPIRYPVYELTVTIEGNEKKIYYDKAYIYAWLENKQESPVTKKFLAKENLIFDRALAKKIQDRIIDLLKEQEKKT